MKGIGEEPIYFVSNLKGRNLKMFDKNAGNREGEIGGNNFGKSHNVSLHNQDGKTNTATENFGTAGGSAIPST